MKQSSLKIATLHPLVAWNQKNIESILVSFKQKWRMWQWKKNLGGLTKPEKKLWSRRVPERRNWNRSFGVFFLYPNLDDTRNAFFSFNSVDEKNSFDAEKQRETLPHCSGFSFTKKKFFVFSASIISRCAVGSFDSSRLSAILQIELAGDDIIWLVLVSIDMFGQLSVVDNWDACSSPARTGKSSDPQSCVSFSVGRDGGMILCVSTSGHDVVHLLFECSPAQGVWQKVQEPKCLFHPCVWRTRGL